ncbi:hypothetical protein AJ80_03904 [Polytolypa hystricis UAMH7299]|uniref:chitinase n=1 Tax=Polytolypa hystricis (strain UAMH7299) TaxID=1447883 RepID=A0A2B7YF84_POLH7|nr:hypothetical protein AJ80_03904 [Polytolypa hystricis UAMH7299]
MLFTAKVAALSVALAIWLSSLFSPVWSQTYTSCNPLTQSCPADPALGKSASFDLTKESPRDWSARGTVTYDKINGASFAVAKRGDGPLIQSHFYIMFGRVSITLKAAPGVGIVSSVVLQSDCLDEIDWEWLGSKGNEVQTNYFGKGRTEGHKNGQSLSDPNNNGQFQTYTIDWNSERILWQIDGTTVRTLNAAEAANGLYPQTPSHIKVGVWAGGDPENAPGTIEWAGGQTDYSAGPYVMQVKSINVTDYSTGSKYEYSDKTGSWKSIKAVGGQVNGSGDPGKAPSSSSPPISLSPTQASSSSGT